MNTILIFIMIVPLVVGLLLGINFLLAPHKPYKEKKTFFECGLVSFLLQNRKQVGIAFFLFGILYLAFDLEITLLYPFTVSFYLVSIFGLVIYLLFNYYLGFAFVFEYGRGALAIELKKLKKATISAVINTKQTFTSKDYKNVNTNGLIPKHSSMFFIDIFNVELYINMYSYIVKYINLIYLYLENMLVNCNKTNLFVFTFPFIFFKIYRISYKHTFNLYRKLLGNYIILSCIKYILVVLLSFVKLNYFFNLPIYYNIIISNDIGIIFIILQNFLKKTPFRVSYIFKKDLNAIMFTYNMANNVKYIIKIMYVLHITLFSIFICVSELLPFAIYIFNADSDNGNIDTLDSNTQSKSDNNTSSSNSRGLGGSGNNPEDPEDPKNSKESKNPDNSESELSSLPITPPNPTYPESSDETSDDESAGEGSSAKPRFPTNFPELRQPGNYDYPSNMEPALRLYEEMEDLIKEEKYEELQYKYEKNLKDSYQDYVDTKDKVVKDYENERDRILEDSSMTEKDKTERVLESISNQERDIEMLRNRGVNALTNIEQSVQKFMDKNNISHEEPPVNGIFYDKYLDMVEEKNHNTSTDKNIEKSLDKEFKDSSTNPSKPISSTYKSDAGSKTENRSVETTDIAGKKRKRED